MMRQATAWCVAAAVTMFAGTLGAQETGQSPSPSALLEAADQAVADGQYSQALERYEQLRQLMPEAPQIPYNMGVAAYRDGDLDRAAEFFAQALALAKDLPLRSRSAYNLGTTGYARSLQPGAQEAQADPAGQLDQAMEELREALGHYRQALDGDPQDPDARTNAELTYRRLKRLEELKQQMQQQQQQQGDSSQPQDQDQDQQQQGGDQDQQQQDQQQQQQEQGQDRQQQQAGQEEEQAQQEDQAGQAQAEEDEREGSAQRRTMTREEAERLLQSVRDKERGRLEELARRERSRRPPVEKDW
jgi:Ca-activated chloride channel family protein